MQRNDMHAVSLDSGLGQCLGPTQTWIHISGRYLAFLAIF